MDRAALREKLSAETGFIGWSELERHFARGVLIVVAPELDLLDVAIEMAEDNVAALRAWANLGHVGRAGDDQARSWGAAKSTLRAVVVAPWILVQEIRTH